MPDSTMEWKEIQTINQRLDTLSTKIDELMSALTGDLKQPAGLNVRVANNEKLVQAVSDRVDKLETRVDTLEEIKDALANQAKGVKVGFLLAAGLGGTGLGAIITTIANSFGG